MRPHAQVYRKLALNTQWRETEAADIKDSVLSFRQIFSVRARIILKPRTNHKRLEISEYVCTYLYFELQFKRISFHFCVLHTFMQQKYG